MKNKKNLIILLFVVSIGLIGVTMAYTTNSTNLENVFKTATLSATSYENIESPNGWMPENISDKKLYITNEYNNDVAVRVSFEEKWISSNGEEISNYKDDNKIAFITLANKKDWIKKGDYYYYRYKLSSGQSTSSFSYSITFNRDSGFPSECQKSYTEINCVYDTGEYKDSTYKVIVKIEKVQYENYKNIWDNDVNILNEKFVTATDILISKSNSLETVYENGDKGEMYTFEHPATNQTLPLTDYRYIGNSPKNYVKFNCDEDGNNCETWRIIGIFDVDDGNGFVDKRIKLVRGYEFDSKMHWNVNEESDWTSSSLKNFLNDDYYNSNNDISYGLKNSARSLIDDAKYYLGGRIFDQQLHYGDTENVYKWERGFASYNFSRPLNWSGKVALMYPSDVYMTYAKGVNDTCYNDPYLCNNSTIASTGWIYNTNYPEGQESQVFTWLISQGFLDISNAYYTMSQGQLYFGHVNNGLFGVRPVIYLKSDVKIMSGTGDESSPYVFYN